MRLLNHNHFTSPMQSRGWRFLAVTAVAMMMFGSGADLTGLFAQGDGASFPEGNGVKPIPKKSDARPPADAEAAEKSAEEENAEPNPIFGLFPIGRPFKGVRIPSYTGDRLDSVVRAEVMRRLDDKRFDMEAVVITSFGGGDEPDTDIYMEQAIYDSTTERLTSDTPTRIVQPGFEMRGDTMVFDKKTQIGHMKGNVEMRIFQVDQIFSGGILSGEGTE